MGPTPGTGRIFLDPYMHGTSVSRLLCMGRVTSDFLGCGGKRVFSGALYFRVWRYTRFFGAVVCIDSEPRSIDGVDVFRALLELFRYRVCFFRLLQLPLDTAERSCVERWPCRSSDKNTGTSTREVNSLLLKWRNKGVWGICSELIRLPFHSRCC